MKRQFGLTVAVLILLLTSLFPTVLHAQVYKWKDAQGHLHFSDAAPPGQKKVDTVDLPAVSPEAPVADVTEQERMERQKRLTQALEEDRLEKERVKEEAKAKAAKKAAYCERFKNRMVRLERSSQVYSENKNGTVTYWKDEDADRLKAEQRARYQRECSQD